ncbi:MAG: sulfate adenylyltransferase subunit 1 [Solirubrobacteraceae bacterium]
MTLDLLRFTTAGSVDDGKSTLIGRLLFDTKQVFDDQLEHVAQASLRRGGEGTLDLALLTDGLRAEREQGITIDVAYRYFATAGNGSPGRRFIIADCPGHQQYTRNMVTGASTADLAVVLLDARHGPLEQSKRHAFISTLLGIPHLVVAVNKMDLVDHSQDRFDEIVAEFSQFARHLHTTSELAYIPMSALHGDNVVQHSERMSWYAGPTLLELLETVEVAYDHPFDTPARFPVQWVVRPGGAANDDYRGYAGQLASGALRVGEEVLALPSGKRTKIAAIDTYDGPLETALAPMSVTIRLAEQLDVSRGELLCRAAEAPTVARELTADICWMTDTPLRPGGRYLIKQTTKTVHAIVSRLQDIVDVHTLQRSAGPGQLALNDIGRVELRLSAPIAIDPYAENRRTGSFIVIDEASNGTVGAGMIRSGS